MRLWIITCWCLLSCQSGGWEGSSGQATTILRTTMLDVGQGLSILLENGPHILLYDTGPDSTGLADTLQTHGISQIDDVVISHWHRDHAGGLSDLLYAVQQNHLRIRRVLYSSDTADTAWRDSLLEACNDLGIESRKLSRSDTIATLHPFKIRVLWPPAEITVGGNDASLVLRISDNERHELLMGDLESSYESSLLEREPYLQAEVLQVGHHGSRTASSWSFLSTVQPLYALISVGQHNDYGHPHSETLSKLKLILPDTTRLLRTDQQSSITLEWMFATGIWQAVF